MVYWETKNRMAALMCYITKMHTNTHTHTHTHTLLWWPPVFQLNYIKLNLQEQLVWKLTIWFLIFDCTRLKLWGGKEFIFIIIIWNFIPNRYTNYNNNICCIKNLKCDKHEKTWINTKIDIASSCFKLREGVCRGPFMSCEISAR